MAKSNTPTPLFYNWKGLKRCISPKGQSEFPHATISRHSGGGMWLGEPVSVAVATGVSKGSCSWEPCQLTALVDVISVEFFHLLRRSVVPFGPLVVFFVSGVLLKMFRMCNKRCRTGNSFYVQVTVYRALCRSARATSCFTSRAQLALNHVGYFSPWHSFAVNRSWCTVLLCVAVCPGLCLMFYLCVACWVRASRRVTREMCSHSHLSLIHI